VATGQKLIMPTKIDWIHPENHRAHEKTLIDPGALYAKSIFFTDRSPFSKFQAFQTVSRVSAT
jgi:hypothetical protein